MAKERLKESKYPEIRLHVHMETLMSSNFILLAQQTMFTPPGKNRLGLNQEDWCLVTPFLFLFTILGWGKFAFERVVRECLGREQTRAHSQSQG